MADVDEAYADLSARGVPFHVPPEDFPPEAPTMRIAFFRDPDGNVIELIQPLGDPVSRERTDGETAVGAEGSRLPWSMTSRQELANDGALLRLTRAGRPSAPTTR